MNCVLSIVILATSYDSFDARWENSLTDGPGLL